MSRFHLSLLAIGMLLIALTGSVTASTNPSRLPTEGKPADSHGHGSKSSPWRWSRLKSSSSGESQPSSCNIKCRKHALSKVQGTQCLIQNGQGDLKCLCKSGRLYWSQFSDCVKKGIPANKITKELAFSGCPKEQDTIDEHECSRCNALNVHDSLFCRKHSK